MWEELYCDSCENLVAIVRGDVNCVSVLCPECAAEAEVDIDGE